MEGKLRHRWFRFRLQSLLLVVALLCVYLGWSTHWLRERRELLEGKRRLTDQILDNEEIRQVMRNGCYQAHGPPPLLLWPFEEFGVKALHLGQATEAEFRRALTLFPEANYVRYIDDTGKSTVAEG